MQPITKKVHVLVDYPVYEVLRKLAFEGHTTISNVTKEAIINTYPELFAGQDDQGTTTINNQK